MADALDETVTGGESFAIPSLANLRDIGGCRSSFSGVVRTGVVFRSTDLSRLTDTDLETLDALSIATVFDLRTLEEQQARPDRVPDGARHLGLDVLADREGGSIAAALPQLVSNPELVSQILGDGRATDYLRQSYRDFVTLPSAVASYRTLADTVAHGDVPGLVHCSAGKDRTGWAAASLLLFAGADQEAVFADYLRTNDELLPHFDDFFARFASLGGDPELITPLLGVRREYLEVAIEEALSRYGTIEQYFAAGLGLDDDTLQALRTRLVDPDATA
ncbi:tyrosine-protein phosphatase [Rhodococcus pyridinivorans]|uniref:tyrosine-protein phosphatase n=1 Tax=Rhodococcus TaxID=1827 RepID=UPI000EB30C90|nr:MULTISPECIES: tyrosine-protein phosphatase [Rhodococcus]MBX4170671.1 tyrosine-protein phosphatase [Rhodococcus sp. DMU2021]QXF83337.1 tyrosine-protein phosphatase [Rhodococcus pyridinivorans]